MTAISLPRTEAANPFRAGATPNRTIARLANGVRRWAGRRQTYGALSALDDHMLKDIGLHRSMIRSISVHGVRGVEEATGPDFTL